MSSLVGPTCVGKVLTRLGFLHPTSRTASWPPGRRPGARAIGSPIWSKAFEHQELTVTWSVLVHNLWVLARLEKIEQPDAQARAA